jgi:hypothetical protein
MTSPADIFDGIAKVEVQLLIPDEVPNLDGSSLVVTRTMVGRGHLETRLVMLLDRQKF